MGKEWDGGDIAFQVDTWRKCFELLKPGGHLIAFSGSRTYHRMAVAIEDAGFEIRDQCIWLYGSGFPKSLNIFSSPALLLFLFSIYAAKPQRKVKPSLLFEK